MITKMSQSIISPFLPAANSGGFFFPAPIISAFPVTPPGYVQTGTISAICQQVVTPGTKSSTPIGTFDSGNDLLSQFMWTLYRNGQAEQTWQGAAMLCNVQSFGDSNDQLTVVGSWFPGGFNPSSSVNLLDYPINVAINYIGYVGLATEVPLTVPFVSMSQQTTFQASRIIVPDYNFLNMAAATAVLPSGGNQTLIATTPPGVVNVMLISAYVSLSIGGSAGATAVTASIMDAAGVVYCAASIVDGTGGNSTATTDNNLYGILTDQFPLILHFQTSGAAPNAVCSAGLLWQPENLVTALVQPH